MKKYNLESGLSKPKINVEAKYNEALIKALSFQPDVVGYSVMTGEHYDIIGYNKIQEKWFYFGNGWSTSYI